MKTSKKKRFVKRQNRRPLTERRLGAEPLEGRILLAADMAAWSVEQQSDEQAEEKTDSSITRSETSSSETKKKPAVSNRHGKQAVVSLPKQLKLGIAERLEVHDEEIVESEGIHEFDNVDISAVNDALAGVDFDTQSITGLDDVLSGRSVSARLNEGPVFSMAEMGFGESMAADNPLMDVVKRSDDFGYSCLEYDSSKWHGGEAQQDYICDMIVREVVDARNRAIEIGHTPEESANAMDVGFASGGKRAEVDKAAADKAAADKAAADKAAKEQKKKDENKNDDSSLEWFSNWLSSTPAPEDMQGDHPLPADLLAGLAAATAQAYQDFYSLHAVGDGRNPEYSPEAGFAPQGYSRQDIEDAVSLSGGGGCGQDDEETTINPNSLRRTFTLSNTINDGCMGPNDLF